METNERFTSKTKLDEILRLDIKEVAKLRWNKYQECWSAKNFLWWEFCYCGEKSPVENINLDYSEKFAVPLPITELAIDFLFYISIKEDLINLISRNNLIDRYILYVTNLDKYLSEVTETHKKIWEEHTRKIKEETTLITIKSGQHLKVVR